MLTVVLKEGIKAEVLADMVRDGTYTQAQDPLVCLEAEALRDQAIKIAKEQGASLACVFSGAALIVYERVGSKERSEWTVWSAIMLHSAFSMQEVELDGGEENSIPLTPDDTRQGIHCFKDSNMMALFFALATYARAKHALLPFEPAPDAEEKPAIDSQQQASAHDGPGDGGAADIGCNATEQKHWSLGQSRLAVSETSDVWYAWDSTGAKSDGPTLIYKQYVSEKGENNKALSTLRKEREIYGIAAEAGLQESIVPRLVAFGCGIVSSTAQVQSSCSSSGHDTSAESALSRRPSSGLLLTYAGCSLQMLADLGVEDKYLAWQARKPLLKGYLDQLARYFSDKEITSSDAAVADVVELVVAALHKLHEAGILHGDIAARHICVRDVEPAKLAVSFIDFQWSELRSSPFPPVGGPLMKQQQRFSGEDAQSAKYSRANAARRMPSWPSGPSFRRRSRSLLQQTAQHVYSSYL